MQNILLSKEAYEILLEFEQFSPMPDQAISHFSEACIDQLCEHGLIESRITDYDTSGSWIAPKYSEYTITEKGKGYLLHRQSEDQTLNTLKSMATSAEEQAKAAKTQAELATKAAEAAEADAKKARGRAAISIVISLLSVLATLFSGLLAEFAYPIMQWFLKLF